MSALNTPGKKIHAGVILTKGVTEMLDLAPFELFTHLNGSLNKALNFPEEMAADILDIECHWVTEDGGVAKLKSGAVIQPSHSFQTCPPLDIALMGAHDSYHYKLSDGEKAFIRQTYEGCSAFLTVCGGIFALLESGLLGGLTVSAPRPAVKMLNAMAPHVTFVDRRWSHDGKVWTSSTLLNGTDMMRAFATETWGGRTGFVEASLDMGAWPARDVDFKDFKGYHFEAEAPPGFGV
ncbi:hypothetical protein N3K66_000375 [Trichothecium roseum]|jgi:transcriptional regulator GlxA family with amidase domain|uniref:Uncharacterized protein n=1 Tax=Trichothecium roseum TaxID=47278 RepID=A0ACC0VD87_9HYPO|nr:hypothetical protein N3K66_000375 [Trichothecium roseum]